MIRVLALTLAVLATACVPVQRQAQPKPPVGPEMVVLISKTGQPARDLLELVAARCWLDGVVLGAQLIVDRQTGRVIIVDETSDLLAADFLANKGGRSRVRLSGPVVGDPIKANKLVESLDRAVRTGETACPPLVG